MPAESNVGEEVRHTLGAPGCVYRNGQYLEQHPRWHAEHSAWKAAQVLTMIRRSRLQPRSVCEIGCGAGELLRCLQDSIGPSCRFHGFDISPQAIELCESRANTRLRYSLIENEAAIEDHFDLLVSVDVIEHVEDWIGHLRQLRPLATHKIFHVPLDLSVQTLLRTSGLVGRKKSHGHLHYFTKEVFLAMLADLGYQVRDVIYTKRALDIGSGFGQAVVNLARGVGFTIHPDLTVRTLGGFSLAVLAV